MDYDQYGSRVYAGWRRHSQVLPWLDFSSEALPQQHRSVLDFCHFLWCQNSDIREGLRRAIAYFKTDIEILSLDPDENLSTQEKEKWRTYFLDTLRIQEQFSQVGMDLTCYGNYFLTVVVPFERFLACPQCEAQFSLEVVATQPVFKFQWDGGRLLFLADCPRCHLGRGYRGPWRVRDYPLNLEKNLGYKFLPPQEMEQLYCDWTGKSSWRWRIPGHYTAKIRRGDRFHLASVPQVVLECIRHGVPLQFHEDMILHGRENVPSGLPNRGWGISRILLAFRDLWQLQVLRRANEALTLDYLIPTRLIFPAPRGGVGPSGQFMDFMVSTNQREVVSMIRRIFRDRSSDPLAAYYLPMPVETRLLGGEANQFVTVQLLDAAQQQALNALGLPLDFYRGSLQTNAILPGLKLMEAQWQHIPENHNRVLDWWVRKICDLLEWEPVLARVVPVAHAIGIQEQVLKAQLAMSNVVSSTELLRGMGLRWTDQQRAMMDEARFQAQLQENLQREMQDREMARQFLSQPGFPALTAAPPAAAEGAGAESVQAAPAPAGVVSQTLGARNPQVPITPAEIVAEAEAIAQQLAFAPPSQRISELRQLKQQDSLLHAYVTKLLEAYRQQMRNEGGRALAQQQGSTLL